MPESVGIDGVRIDGSRIGGYRESAPPAALESVLDCLWVHEPPPAPAALGAHRVIPHFGASLTLERRFDAAGELVSAKALVLGPVSRPRLYPVEAGKEMISLRLRPELCGALLGVEAAALWNAVEDYSAFCPRRSRQLLHGLDPAAPAARVLGHLLRWLERRAAALSGRDEVRSWSVVEHLRRHHGAVPVDDLVREHGRSPQYMRRVFRRGLGTTPKRIACLLRLNAAIGRADREASPSWADIAARYGYSDQAHLVHETKRWTGLSPTALHAERRAELDPYCSPDKTAP